jgi:hypothetical protein
MYKLFDFVVGGPDGENETNLTELKTDKNVKI